MRLKPSSSPLSLSPRRRALTISPLPLRPPLLLLGWSPLLLSPSCWSFSRPTLFSHTLFAALFPSLTPPPHTPLQRRHEITEAVLTSLSAWPNTLPFSLPPSLPPTIFSPHPPLHDPSHPGLCSLPLNMKKTLWKPKRKKTTADRREENTFMSPNLDFSLDRDGLTLALESLYVSPSQLTETFSGALRGCLTCQPCSYSLFKSNPSIHILLPLLTCLSIFNVICGIKPKISWKKGTVSIRSYFFAGRFVCLFLRRTLYSYAGYELILTKLCGSVGHGSLPLWHRTFFLKPFS